MSWLREFIERLISMIRGDVSPGKDSKGPVPPINFSIPKKITPPTTNQEEHQAAKDIQVYLDRVHEKVRNLGRDFADGKINRTQFQELYSHYQTEIRNITSIIEMDPESWHKSVTEGESVFIRKRHLARARAYAIYENDSGLPLATLGKFDHDPALMVPMLSSFRSATNEIFGAGIKITQLGTDQWLCFVPGNFTTMIALFTNEPAGKQLDFMEQLHETFEQANANYLKKRPIDVDTLIFPHEYYLGKWKL